MAVNLAVQMQKMGKRVLVFDADFGLANVEVMFGAIPKYKSGRCDISWKTDHGDHIGRSDGNRVCLGEPELPDWAI